MQNTKQVLTSNNTGTSKLNTTSILVGNKYDYDCDKLYSDYKELVGDSRFKAYYVNAFYKLGKDTVERLASIAKADGVNNFGWLVSKELDKTTKKPL